MENLAEITNVASDWLFYVGTALGVGGLATVFVRAMHKTDKAYKERLDELKASYSDDLGRDELIEMYNRARGISCRALGKRTGEAKELIQKLEAQLRPIIKNEVRASLDTADIKPGTSLEDLSATYKEVFSRRGK